MLFSPSAGGASPGAAGAEDDPEAIAEPDAEADADADADAETSVAGAEDAVAEASDRVAVGFVRWQDATRHSQATLCIERIKNVGRNGIGGRRSTTIQGGDKPGLAPSAMFLTGSKGRQASITRRQWNSRHRCQGILRA